MKLYVTEPDFPEKFLLLPKLGKWTKNGPKTGFFEFIENFVINFYGICSIIKIYIICCVPCTNSLFGKILVPEIWAKMFSANQIAGFFNQPYLQNKSMKQRDFLRADTNSHKLKVNQEIFG